MLPSFLFFQKAVLNQAWRISRTSKRYGGGGALKTCGVPSISFSFEKQTIDAKNVNMHVFKQNRQAQ